MQRLKMIRIAITALAVIAVVLMPLAGASAASKERVLYSFKNDGNDGAVPYAGLISDMAGNLYGTTVAGGAHQSGTAFELTRGAHGRWTEKVLYSFNGDSPYAGLIFDTAGNLYGMTAQVGTVFELTLGANGQWSETVLYTVGGYPYGGLVFDATGNLYGTTFEGSGGPGTVFELTPGNGQWTETVLYDFPGGHGAHPNSGLVFDTAGNLYGTAIDSFHGQVFELTPGSNGWTENVIHGFGRRPDGAHPLGGLIFDLAGNLYGTTTVGGTHFRGMAFELTPAGRGQWTETVLHSFGKGKDGQSPQAGLFLDTTGKLYGTTQKGGAFGVGTVFVLIHGAHGQWTEKVVHTFGYGTDGSFPYADLIEMDGKLYGTTAGGGANGVGTVFELTQ